MPCPDDGVLMSVEAISVEGGDLLARAAVPPPESPHIVGYLCAGTVLEVGGGVDGRAIGERIVALT
jgi:NADPH2:quinone reductase